jgi:nucleoside-diphosphate-sugar epimerase
VRDVQAVAEHDEGGEHIVRLLILGGGRFQGRRAAELLRDLGHEVVVMNRSQPVPGTRYIRGERHDLAVLTQALQRDVDVVIDNLAFQREDVEMLLPLMKGRVGHYILISSFVVYLPAKGFDPVREEDADLSSRYGSSYDVGKRQCEEALLVGAEDLSWTVLRFHNIEGVGDPSNRRGFFIDRVADGQGVLLPSDVAQPFQPLWRDDAAAAVVSAAGNPSAYGHVFNIAGSEIYTLTEWLGLLADALNCQAPLVIQLPWEAIRKITGFEYRLPLPMRPILDIQKAQTLLGFKPTPAAQWVPGVVHWWRASGLTSRFWEHRPLEIEAIRRITKILDAWDNTS